jgi:hypothetical protein
MLTNSMDQIIFLELVSPLLVKNYPYFTEIPLFPCSQKPNTFTSREPDYT